MRRFTTLLMFLPVVVILLLAVGIKNMNPVTAFIHNDADISIREISFDISADAAGTLVNNGYFEVIIPENWTYSDWRDDLRDSKYNIELVNTTSEQYLSEYHGARAVRDGIWDYVDSSTRDPAMVIFNFRSPYMRYNNTTNRDLKPRENASITVNGRQWTGFHGLSEIDTYVCCLEAEDDDGWFLEVSIHKGNSKTFTLEDEGLLVMLASMHHLSRD